MSRKDSVHSLEDSVHSVESSPPREEDDVGDEIMAALKGSEKHVDQAEYAHLTAERLDPPSPGEKRNGEHESLHDAVTDQNKGREDEEGGATTAATADEIDDEEETTDDDSVNGAKGDAAKGDSVSDGASERAGERPPEVDVVPPVLLGANDNWDAETVPMQGEEAASTDDALAASGTPAGADAAGGDADAHDGESQSGSEKVQDLIRSMERTNNLMIMREEKIASLVDKKRKIKAGRGGSMDKKKRAKAVKDKLKRSCRMLETLEGAMEVQRQELQKLNPNQYDNEVGESDGSSSGYESS